MTTAPVAIVDVLASLLEAEHNSVFRLMGEASPYLKQAPQHVRDSLTAMVRGCYGHARELAELITQLGGKPMPDPPAPTDDEMLQFLSLKFLLPKLVNSKQLMIERYRNALRILSDGPPEVVSLLRRHLDKLKQDLQLLQSLHAS